MLDNRSLALPARVFRLKDVLDAMPEWLQRRSGTRKATAEALRDHFKAKQWPVPIRPDGRTRGKIAFHAGKMEIEPGHPRNATQGHISTKEQRRASPHT
jgi:hypothetical protein